MIAWSWTAGCASGLTDSQRRARRHAAGVLLHGDADTAVLQGVLIDTGALALEVRYRPVDGMRTVGRVHGGRVRWRDAAVPREGEQGNVP